MIHLLVDLLCIEPLSIFEINNKINNLAIEETKEIERILAMLTNLLKPISRYENRFRLNF